MLGYKNSTGLMYRIKSNGIPEGGDISHLHTCRSKIFIVNGQEVNITAAAGILGYDQSTLSRKIASLSLPEGSDISHLGKAFYIVNGEKMDIPRAAAVLGYDRYWLSKKLKRCSVPPGSDISHMTPGKRRQ